MTEITEKKAAMIFIPPPGLIGHLVSMVEFAKLLTTRDDNLSITILLMKPFNKKDSNQAYLENLAASLTENIKFLHLPQQNCSAEYDASFLYQYINMQKQVVRDAIKDIKGTESFHVMACFLDFFCTTMIDVANEFDIPSYIFCPSSAGFVGIMLHLQDLLDNKKKDISEYDNTHAELVPPCFANPLPSSVLPPMALDKDHGLLQARRFRETKGIVVNTFFELESHAINSLSSDKTIPPIYPVGPLLNLNQENDQISDILEWLDEQPPCSVIFLCFGSMGCFEEDQVKEIAKGLECSGCKFLWSLRTKPSKHMINLPGDRNLEILPEGFLERTAGTGKVIGWAPQARILAHSAIGGFVSHCGWNSTLESIWHGVPIATWPIYAEQQLNAFEMVKELGMAVEIRLDYMRDFQRSRGGLVMADEIERGIKRLMDGDDGNEVRKKVKEMKELCRKVLMEGGSSYNSVYRLILDMKNNA